MFAAIIAALASGDPQAPAWTACETFDNNGVLNFVDPACAAPSIGGLYYVDPTTGAYVVPDDNT